MKPIAGPPHKNTRPPHRDQYWSKDGQWYWDGTQWVSSEAISQAPGEPRLSPDKQWRWDGSQWVSNLSPDGQWLFDGANWIPNPAIVAAQPVVQSPVALPPAAPVAATGVMPIGTQIAWAITILFLVGMATYVGLAIIHNDGIGGGTYSLHYPCGSSPQCASARGNWSGIRGTYSSEADCTAAGEQMGMTEQAMPGQAGWFCNTNSDPNER